MEPFRQGFLFFTDYESLRNARLLPELEPALENHFSQGNHQKNAANHSIQTEERHVDPVQTTSAGDPMLQDKAANNQYPANDVSDTKAAEQSKRSNNPHSTT